MIIIFIIIDVLNVKIGLIDSYLHDIELLRILSKNKFTIKISLIDLADKVKVR